MNLDEARALFRKELGLPEHGRLVMTGHQCSLWHAGILAKYIWCDRLVHGQRPDQPHAVPLVARPRDTSALPAENNFDHAAWLWVDQDTDETHTLRIPTRVNGLLGVADWRLHPPPSADMPAASVPTFRPAPFTGEPALPSVRSGIGAFVNALNRNSNAPNAASQTAAAVTDLLTPLLNGPIPPAAFATAFMTTELGAALISRMRDDPRTCAEHYNSAVFANPRAGVANLAVGDGDGGVELPLWWVTPVMPRRRVFARDLRAPDFDPQTLAPRALLMTGMARLAACDLFVHGTGGGIYDTITEAWFRDWLGVELAPTIVVTADVRLPLHAREATEKEVAVARWKAHHARHEPAMLDDLVAARRKAAHVEAIRAARAGGIDPAPIYREMHQELDIWRRGNTEALEALSREADELAAMLGEREIANDRTWPFVFHGADALRAMQVRTS